MWLKRKLQYPNLSLWNQGRWKMPKRSHNEDDLRRSNQQAPGKILVDLDSAGTARSLTSVINISCFTKVGHKNGGICGLEIAR